ncbi:MAG: glycosyltransferase [Chitinivibrionales bacterium]|nr:glycosyltransferase [Chitinivibrionales bacterium]
MQRVSNSYPCHYQTLPAHIPMQSSGITPPWQEYSVEGTGERPVVTIAQVVSRFPKLSETFVLHEMIHLQREYGIRVELFALVRESTKTMHRDAVPFLRRLNSRPLLSGQVIGAQLYWLMRRSGTYARLWAQILAGSASSPRVLIRSVVVLLKAALFAQQARRLRVHHIHAHFATYPALAAYCMHRLSRIPYTFTAHAHDIYMWKQWSLLAHKCRAASGIVTISEYNRSLLCWLCGTQVVDRVHVIRCGVDTVKFHPAQLRKRRGPLVLCVASLEPYKGQEYLLQACVLLRRRGVQFSCVCVGAGSTLIPLRKQVEAEGLQDKVRLIGPQPEHRVHRLLRRASVFAHPSVVMKDGRADGVPVALMEAMAMGVPCISTKVSGIPELVEDRVTGLLVRQRDAAALADAIELILSDHSLSMTLATRARARIEKEYDRRANVGRLAEILIPLTREGHKPTPCATDVPVNSTDAAEWRRIGHACSA